MKTLSVIMGLYNSAEYMPKCIESLVNQDIPREELEIIMVNDGSPDNSLEVANQYAEQYPECIKIVSHSVNKGLAAARNTGLDNATGKYVTFTDPDDYVLPNSVKYIIEIMEKDNLDMLRFDYFYVNDKGVEIPKPKSASKINYSPCVMDGKSFLAQRLGLGCFVWPFFYRLDIINKNKIRLIQGLFYDDTEWLPRVLCVANRVSSIPYKRYYYVQRPGTLTHLVDPVKQKRMAYALIDVVKALQIDKKVYPDCNVRKWYDSMISGVAFSSINASVKLDCYDDIVKTFIGLNIFPLYVKNNTFNATIKMFLLNISPSLYRFVFKSIYK